MKGRETKSIDEEREDVDERIHPRWRGLWDNGVEVGELFDKGSPCPALVKLEENQLLPQGRALVPGCGRGYDVTFLSSSERFVLGLDIAETAIKVAQGRAEELANMESPNDPSSFLSQIEFSTTSFFDLPDDCDSDKFDLIYDYTFLCALHPSVREHWAKKMSRLLAPGGQLVTLIFPICDKADGPPFAMSMELVRSLLEGTGFRALQLESLSSDLCHPGRDGSGPWGASSAIGRWCKE